MQAYIWQRGIFKDQASSIVVAVAESEAEARIMAITKIAAAYEARGGGRGDLASVAAWVRETSLNGPPEQVVPVGAPVLFWAEQLL